MDTPAQGIGNLTAQTITVEPQAKAFGHPVADEARHGERHEERGKLNEVFQIDGHRREEDAIAEGAQEGGQIKSLDIQCGRHVEIEQHLIHKQSGKANNEQPGVFESEEFRV